MIESAPRNRRKYGLFLVAFVIALGADQASKMWARAELRPRCRVLEPLPYACPPREVIPGWFDLRYSENPGSAFGLFRDLPLGRWLLLVVGIGALVVVYRLLRKLAPDQLRVAMELGLLAGGALGNIVDRLTRSVVTDFVVWKFHGHTIFGMTEWPTFNIADAALVVGVLALFFDMKSDPAKEAAAQPHEKKRR